MIRNWLFIGIQINNGYIHAYYILFLLNYYKVYHSSIKSEIHKFIMKKCMQKIMETFVSSRTSTFVSYKSTIKNMLQVEY